MGDKEIKACLKEAREQIKSKDFKSALKECKKVLNKDKNNYMALVFCGLCLSELDQADQSLQAYKRAADSSPDQPIAWEGLAKFYEKHKSSVKVDHYLEVLQKLMEFYSEDESKHFDVCSKLAQLQLENKDLDGSIATLQSQSEKSSGNQQKYKESLESLIKVLTSQPSLNEDQSVALLNALEKTVNDNQTPTNMDNLKHLIKLQYKLKSISNLAVTAVKMMRIFPENIYPLEWICKIYLETVAGVWSLEDEEVFHNIETHFSALLSYSNSSLAELARGAFLFKKGSLEDCVALLKKITNIQTPNFYGLYILCQAQLAMGEEAGVEATAAEALKYTSKVKDEEKKADMTHNLQLCLVQSLYNQLSHDKILKAVQIVENSDTSSPEIAIVAAKVYATIGEEKKARGCMSLLPNLIDCDKQLIEALILKASGEIEKFISTLQGILSEFPGGFEVTVLLAQSLYEQGREDESFGLFLKAAKLKPTHWLPFFHLGKQYESQKTEAALDKARKCYQKCLQLCGNNNVEAATSLSDILRGQGRHEDNLALLSRVTQEAGTRGGAAWAWLRLGVHHLAVDEPARGVTALQNALRSEPENIVCWEALGDAYMARGSYVAARKAFEKVLSMSSESLYSRLMIADIRQKLGYHQDAISDYSELLENNPDYLPALRGLGETQISLAYVNLQQFVDRNVLDCCESSLSVLTRAAILQPGMAGTWRLLGEAASLVSALSEAVVTGVRVPSVLLRTEAGPEDTDLCDRAALLELSVRCYTKSLALEPRAPPTWHDLGLAQAATGSLDTASVSLKRAISLDPRQAQFWNSLGLILTKQENWALAQHCYIKSLELDVTSMAWTNLGVVYISLGEQGLANKAFKEAQNSDPDYIRGWTGQAILAEIVGVRSEAMDLFRHCTFLGPEPESGRGYSDWVCGTLASLEKSEEVEAHNRYILRNMWGVSVGLDSLAAYTRRHPRDVTAQVQLGVLAERQGMLRTALEATQAALAEVSDPSQRDSVLTNLGRLLTKAGRCEEAVACYKEVSTPSLYSQVGLAMALYKLGEYQLSFQSYDSCLHWLADNDGLKSHVLVAMGSLAYKVEGIEAAKTLLFKSCQLTPPSVRGLFALAVIGVQHTDMNLIEAALHEMKPHVTDPRYAADIAFLNAAVLVLKGDVSGARRSLLSSAHTQPGLPRLWSLLGMFLLQNCPQDTARAAARLATKAGLMRQSVGGGAEVESEEQGVESMVVSTLALIMAGDREAAMSRASHACHVYPHVPETWSLLAAAARTGQSPVSSSLWLPRVLSHVIRLGSDNAHLAQSNWDIKLPIKKYFTEMSEAIYDENGEINLKNQLVIKTAGTLVFHPLELSKVLMQLGHEPLNPRQTKTLFGRPALAYPSVFKYCGHIWHKDGITGLWRGFTPKLLNIFVNHYTEQKFNESYPPAEENKDDEALTMEQKQEKLVRDTVRDIACRLTCVVATQPLQVIAIRAMAEFVGGEEKYSGGLTFGLYSGACSILQDSGILGFWAGLVPRALGEIGLIAVTSGLAFVVNEYIVDDKELQKYTKHFVNFLGSSLFYPLQVTSNCMVVSRSGLAAGYPPRMPLYTGWVDCIKHLRSRGELKRGSSMFFRYYNGPKVIVGDRVIPANSSMFKSAISKQ